MRPAEFFSALPRLRKRLETLRDVGLGYVKLGPALHGAVRRRGPAGEAGHGAEQAGRGKSRSISWTSLPAGLHTDDVRKLLEVLQRLVEAGNTVVVIEHNLDVIKCADHIIDLGPEGGDGGGTIVCTGTPEEVAACQQSYTGQYLKKLLS